MFCMKHTLKPERDFVSLVWGNRPPWAVKSCNRFKLVSWALKRISPIHVQIFWTVVVNWIKWLIEKISLNQMNRSWIDLYYFHCKHARKKKLSHLYLAYYTVHAVLFQSRFTVINRKITQWCKLLWNMIRIQIPLLKKSIVSLFWSSWFSVDSV